MCFCRENERETERGVKGESEKKEVRWMEKEVRAENESGRQRQTHA